MTEQQEYELLASKRARIVFNRKRKVKLRKRGERVWWSIHFNGWMWMRSESCYKECE